MSKISYFIEYFKYLNNPIDCLLLKFGVKNSCTAKPKYYDETFELTSVDEIDTLMFCIGSDRLVDADGAFNFIREMTSNKEIIDWEGINVLNERPGVFVENYLKGNYNEIGLDYTNRIVIDIGANIGDTALFFARNGATVYGFEPVRDLYEIAVRNAELNGNLKDKVHLFNYGVSYKRGKLNIEDMNSASGYAGKKDSYVVDIITIDDILNKYDVKPDILKIDCEGCEFGIIENCDLSMFNDIIFEHHAKMVGSDYKILTDALESQGFTIETYEALNADFNDLGIIHACK